VYALLVGEGGAKLWSATSSDEESEHEDVPDTPMDDSDSDDGSESDGEIIGSNQRNYPLLHDEFAKVVIVKYGKSHFPAVLTSIINVHVPASKTALSKQLKITKIAHQQILYYFACASKPESYQLIPSRRITHIEDVYTIKALRCSPDLIRQAKIFRAQHLAYHARIMNCGPPPTQGSIDEQVQPEEGSIDKQIRPIKVQSLLMQLSDAHESSHIIQDPSPPTGKEIHANEKLLATRDEKDGKPLENVSTLIQDFNREANV
jgi:hypothetical protein